MTRLPILPTLALAGLLLGACSQARVEPMAAAPAGTAQAAPLPRPAQIAVAPFTLDPARVTLDSAPLLRARRAMGGDDTAARQAAAAEAVAAFRTALVAALREKGFAIAEPGAATALPRLVVGGQFTALEEGNRARRAVVGFGLGASRVAGAAELTWQDAAGSRVVDRFTLDADSGRMPGGVLGAGRGAGLVVAGTAIRGAVGEARGPQEIGKLAEGAAERIAAYATAQGWR
ncbi:DUF4410 domain-containing protein [Falsiroseomonas selenitidurans]|uniref:DUF4410 domain-containing protein n=1 Tax=Falsiroseomonas selenitidurans TaxID=2716335 RepID=A0ABX1E013_9PROT|nr:DUF4410 domain-containing protein [Falsiroseomonas selenitidurans]NKC30461.1 DUF4410 domain-containing protein [Falsiroseomonas selenitidurans]